MSLLDQLEAEKYRPENRGHPSEGMLRRGTFTIIEGGESHDYAVRQYPDITLEMLKSDQKLSNGTTLTEGQFEMCYNIYNLQANVYAGTATQEELDEAIANVVANQAVQSQVQQQARQQSGSQQAPQQPQQQTAQPAQPKTTLKDLAKILVNDIGGPLGKPVYQLIDEILGEAESQGFAIDAESLEDNLDNLVEGWKNGTIKIEDDGSFDESLLPGKPEEDEEKQDEEEEDGP